MDGVVTGLLPTRRPALLVLALAAAATLGLAAGLPAALLGALVAALLALLAVALAADAWVSARAWRAGGATLRRLLPEALAIGVRCGVRLELAHPGPLAWRLRLHDHPGAALAHAGLPLEFTLASAGHTSLEYEVTPLHRGAARFEPAEVRVRGRLGLVWLRARIGDAAERRVFPDFAQVARYAWLAGDRRLAEIGIKTWQRRGEGTDFRQLDDYRPGDPVRHIDWKASQRAGRPIVRTYQDERDQNVLLLLDCGRRMRTEEDGPGGGHFDQVLNAAMLLAWVALRQGDAVGAMTFGVPAGSERLLAPTKGLRAFSGLMVGLHDVQPTLVQPDYLAAASEVLRRLRRRSLVVLLTNFRDEDGGELAHALRLLRSRHLVMVASLQERSLAEAAAQPLDGQDAALEVAAAHWLAQRREEAFNRLAARDALMVDALPERLGIELVNRYRSAKSAGVI